MGIVLMKRQRRSALFIVLHPLSEIAFRSLRIVAGSRDAIRQGMKAGDAYRCYGVL
jgi:hypothetical protein